MNTSEPSSPHARLLHISCNLSRPDALGPLSPCLETTRAVGKAIGRRLCPSTHLFAARSTSPRLCPALECPARLGCSRPRMETHSASLSPHRRPPLQCAASRRLRLSPPLLPNPRRGAPLHAGARARPPPLLFKCAPAPFCPPSFHLHCEPAIPVTIARFHL